MKHVAFLIPTIDRIGGDAADQLHGAKVQFVSLGMRHGLADPRGWLRLRRWISENRPEIIHAHLPHATLLARWSRIGSPVRVLLDTLHSPATGGKIRRFNYRITNALPDVVTAVSRTAAEAWLATGAVDEANLVIIPNGIDLHRFKPGDGFRAAVRGELGVSDEFLWIAVGMLDPVKDHATLLHAFSMLTANARLIVAGDGPLRGRLNALTNQLGRVRFFGFEPDVLPWLRAADGFVLCSRWEGMPIALLEASACELPSVVTEFAGANDVLPDSPGCLSVPVGNAETLAASMQHMMGLAVAERCERGRCARNFAAQRFALDAVLDRWEALYDEVLAANPQPRRFGKASSSPGKTFQLQ